MPQPPKDYRSFSSLLEIVTGLRGPNGCPWDQEQTHQSLTQYVIEEAHELAEAIDSNNQEHVIEELGDVLFQVILHSEIAKQAQNFDIYDVIEAVSKKMVRRHPHVFADLKVKDSKEVLKNWSEIKATEKSSKKTAQKFDIPAHLPALIKSQKIGSKTRTMNFDWTHVNSVFAKVEEELAELKQAIAEESIKEQIHELGDLLFSIAQLARHLEFDAEQSLRKANSRFENRFFNMQHIAENDGLDFNQLSPEKREALWEQSKKQLKDQE